MSIEFFRFVRGAETWRFSTLAESVVADGHTWLPAPIQRGSIDVSGEIDKSSVTLSGIRDLAPALAYIDSTPRTPTYVTIYRAELGNAASTFGAIWHGQVSGVRWSGSTLDMTCEPVITQLRRSSPRQRYSSSCRWALYDSGCKVNRNATANFRTGTIIEIDTPLRLKLATTQAFFDGAHWARGGTLAVTSPTGLDAQMVTASDATIVVAGLRERWVELASPLAVFDIGTPIRLQRGCGHTAVDCSAFANTANFGGFPLLPTELNP